MVNWPLWNVGNLFNNQIIPPEVEKRLTEFTEQQQLEFHELLHPCQRLHDLWSCKPGRVTWVPYESWSGEQWQGAMVHLHPVLNTESFKEVLSKAVAEHRVIDIRIGQDAGTPFRVDPEMAGLLLKLATGPKQFVELEKAAEGRQSWSPALAHQGHNWLRMVLERLVEPLYVMNCPPAAL